MIALKAALVLAFVAAPAAAWQEIPRVVLGVYASENIPGEDKDFSFHPLHRRAELALNYLGLTLEPTDITGGLPDIKARADIRGIALWPNRPNAFPDSSGLCVWLREAMERGIKVAILGNPGLYLSKGGGLSPQCRRMFERLGAVPSGMQGVDALSVKVSAAGSAVGFERAVDPSETGAVPLLRALPGSTALLTLRLEHGQSKRSDPVVVSGRGGMALDPFWLYANEEIAPAQYAWVVDPFAFFERVMRTEGLPRPDISTLNGLRIFTTHIDGEGFFNRSEAARGKISAEIFLEEILERYPSTPFTISLIAGYFDLTLYGTKAAAALAREILSRPQVEAASHSYAYPLSWRERSTALRIPRYAMDDRREIADAARMIETKVMAEGERLELLQWTGDSLPTEEQVALAEEAGLLNINGGGGRFDRRHPSYAYLFPFGRMLGARRQIYAPFFSENEFTSAWTQRFYGYRDILGSFTRSESPRRVKPVGVHAHFHSAEKYAALRALKGVYDWALAQPLIPVRTTRWVRAAGGFYAMRMFRDGEKRFRLEGGAALRTVRFDGAAGVPDLARSRGVIGWVREGGALYVALDESETREIVLSSAPRGGPRLEHANFELFDWKAAGGGVRFRMEGWWTPAFTLTGLTPGAAYRVTAPDFAAERTADSDGRLRAALPPAAPGPTTGLVVVEKRN